MRTVFLSLYLFLTLYGCETNSNNSLTTVEQNKLLQFAIKVEENSFLSVVMGAKHGFYYMVGDQFHDSIYLDSNDIHIIDKNINIQEIQKQYKKSLKESNRLISDSFDIVHYVDFSNKSPEFLSFSKPVKYLKYYFINFSYNSWSSGYSTLLIFEKIDSDNFALLYRSVYWIT